MQEKFLEDINKRLLVKQKMETEEALIIFDSLVNKYMKILILDGGDKCDIKTVIKSLPKYSKYFDNSDYNKEIKEYKKSLAEGIYFNESNIEKSISALAKKVVLMQAELGKFSKNSGINIINDRTNYTNNIADFEFATQKFTPEFIKQSLAKIGDDSKESEEACIKKYEYLCKNLAESAINDELSYYQRMTDYLVDFYADNEIASREEKVYG